MSNQTKRVTVGRKQGNSIVLPNPDVSGDHAVLTLKEPETNTWEIQDLGSRNGTFVDGQRILRKEVTPDNKVVFGSTPLVWAQINDKTKAAHPPILKVQSEPQKLTAPVSDILLAPEETEETRLKRVYEDYISKRSQLEEIQRNEALNAPVPVIRYPFCRALCRLRCICPARTPVYLHHWFG